MPYRNSVQWEGPSWKHRRRLIYLSYVLGAAMIIFGALTYLTDTQVGSQMVIGGVGLITIILTAYTGFAAYEDSKLWSRDNYFVKFGEGSSEDDKENPDGI
jgi:predicted signal transduction protein with EAL and GGDEF domain